MNGNTHNPQAELLEKLKKDMPEVFAEGKIDFKKLKATLGEEVVADDERYGLSWAGKSECFKKIQETTTNTLKPCKEKSVKFDDTENIFIEGDNLQVLKTLQKSYYGKVNMIYIDPPYNTGNDFIYNDKFSRTKKEELIAIGAVDEDGNVVNANLYKQNTKDCGHFHSNWMNMMYPRLFLARNLLRQDGVIFVSIDDNELKNLRAMMDEIFGEENFVGSIVWKKKTNGNNMGDIPPVHDYILAYAKSIEDDLLLGFPLSQEYIKRNYSNPDNDSRGIWTVSDLSANHKGPHFGIENKKTGEIHYPPEGRYWVFNKEEVISRINDGKIIFGKNGDGKPVQKVFFSQRKSNRKKAESWWDKHGLNADGTLEINNLIGAKVFIHPKPSILVKHLLNIATVENDLILDFFAGSGTTAHAVMQLNAEDAGNRKWICVQLPETCKEGTEAQKAGYTTIADIAKERIRRAGKKIAEENPKKKLDLGFKVFKCNESNFKVWNTQIENVEQLEQQMMDFIDNVQDESTTENILYELILKSGQELNVPLEEKQADGQSYFRVGNGTLVICLADKLTNPLLEAMLADKPQKIITLDRAFADNDKLKTNILLQAEGAGVEEFKVI